MADENADFNTKIKNEFRANAGKVGPPFEGAPLVILHSTGAKSGEPREHPIVFQDLGDDRWAIFASKAGAPSHPAWYHNLVANPEARAEFGTETVDVTARVLEGDEREAVWSAQKQAMPGFADYEAATTREIPVVELTRR